jgi:(p)ppGpp synthase/HD superfamily hydrolase
MALATPLPAEGVAADIEEHTAGSSLPAAEVALLAPVIQSFLRRHPGDDTSLVVRAAETATVAHAGQLRRSGEPYITHPIAVAGIVADLGLDAQTVAAALLHDAVEDTGVTNEIIERDFGPTVAVIVDGVTKLDRLQFDSKEAQQAATVRKMLVAMANDWRVLIIKLADRLHNMRTLSVMPEWKRRRTAQETLDIYAPLAHRLGIQEVKWQLEDLAFATLHPKRYAEIEQMVATRAPSRDEFLARVLVVVRERMAASGVAAEVTGRPKHLWSIYEKMVVRGKEFDDLFDLVGIRVIVESEKDCWAALGSIHAIWPPVQGRFKDYINSPKFNLYQSLHTTVIGLDGKPIEVQVRTHEMHRRAEYGIAAHWGYKENPSRPDRGGPGQSVTKAGKDAGKKRGNAASGSKDATSKTSKAQRAQRPPENRPGSLPDEGTGHQPRAVKGGLRPGRKKGSQNEHGAGAEGPKTTTAKDAGSESARSNGATITPAQRAELAERDRRAERLALARETSSTTAEIEWMQRIVDFQNETTDPIEFLEALKLDLEEDEVYVFTPKGKVIALTANATPVDFAYAIHTEVGHRCIGAKVNGRLVPLDSRLNSADTVEIFTSKAPTAGPSRDWLSMVVSSRARTKIRQWFSRERREDAIEVGRDELIKELRREGLPVQKLASERTLDNLATEMSFADLDALHAAIGDNRVSARAVAQRLLRDLRGGVYEEQLPVTARQQPIAARPGRGSAVGVYVEGLDDLMVRLSRCCTPVPGDEIVGFVTRGRGVSVHRADCANAASLASRSRERLIEVEWDHRSSGVFVATIEVVAIDRSRLLADVTKVVSEHHLNIVSANTQTDADRISRMRFDVELADPGHLDSVLNLIRHLDAVYDVYRILPGKKD